ncbi:ATP-dependent zinc metalloprotease FtsH-like [Hibiscus syriacus]|uniref:ATP-dependent zinc metalloprotease FtsH-like n=1 Tax=Hibiscus syriacus TaxID=106335 RepID=A0A6A2WF95_HIBSY|nr:ATP-dependent zinc metalloprotease FtsH-like [Hibiscus syriacus]
MQLPGIAHAFLIGDEWQLPATVRSNVSSEAGFGRSLFQRLTTLGHSNHLLNIQYRMYPSISCFPNARLYDYQILDAAGVKQKSYEKHYLQWPMFGPYSFINVSGREAKDDLGRSRRNMVEVAVVQMLVQTLFKAWSSSSERLSIGILSPYAAQVVVIQEKPGKKYEKSDNFEVKVGVWVVTVVKFIR